MTTNVATNIESKKAASHQLLGRGGPTMSVRAETTGEGSKNNMSGSAASQMSKRTVHAAIRRRFGTVAAARNKMFISTTDMDGLPRTHRNACLSDAT
ncbi:MAG: hypothetical protein ACXWF6_18510 [Usitatibacter sp.]